MRLLTKHLLMFAMLCTSGWTFAQTSPAERINLTLVDNLSTYTTAGERNNYVNSLRINQPDGSYKLTAGMLYDGDNNIVFHRIDNSGNDTEFARVNLNAEIDYPDTEYIGILNFYGDGTSAPSSNTTLTNDYLPDNWGTNGSGLVWQTTGYGTVTSSGGLTFTIPDGYTDAIVQMIVYVGSDARGGYFGYNYNEGGWYVTSQVTAGGAYVLRTFTGVNSGDVISIYGGEQSGSSYYLAQSPDIALIAFASIPKSLVPTAMVSPTVCYKNGEGWSSATAMGSATTYSVNDTIDLYGLGTIEDAFYAETDQNNHSDYYNYKVIFGGNIDLPSSGSTGTDFTASADFTAATTTSPTSAAFTGPGYWKFLGTNVYTPTAGTSCYILYYGSMLYMMPDDFMDNSVNVTVTTANSDDGTGDVVVNGISHTFTAGETYTWTIPVTANGAIEFKSDGTTYSPDMTVIVISGGTGAKLSAPNRDNNVVNAKQIQATFQDVVLPTAESKSWTSSKINVK